MVKVVENGERICTVILDGSESSVVFQNDYKYFAVKNESDAAVYVSLNRDIIEGADGVMTIGSKESALFAHMKPHVNMLFVKGTGTIQAFASNTPVNPFKSAPVTAGGGGNVDYATNAGNADKLDGLHAAVFLQNTVLINLSTSINDAVTAGTYGVYSVTPDFPVGYGSWGFLEVRRYGNLCYQTIWFETGIIINRGKNVTQTEWSDWKEISTTPIKSTTFSANADENGNFSLWASGENKVPISIQLDNKTFYAVPFLYNNQIWLGSTINEVTRQPVADVTVSGTIYYIEG